MKQKFRKLTFVHVSDTKEPGMQHFDYNFDAIVEGTYSQEYGGTDIDSYSLFVLKGGKIVNAVAWYKEAQLTALPDQDRDRAEELIEAYHFREDNA